MQYKWQVACKWHTFMLCDKSRKAIFSHEFVKSIEIIFAKSFWDIHRFTSPGLSGASGKFRPLLVAVQYRASSAADVAGVDPTHRDVCAHSSRPSPSLPPPRSLARSR